MKKKRDNAKWIQAETVKKKENRRKGREKKDYVQVVDRMVAHESGKSKDERNRCNGG